MEVRNLVTFLTDFGPGGGYVGACEAAMVRINPSVRVLHLTHEVPVGDVAAAALVLARVAPLCPPAVHLAVVDPGVGTPRRALALVTGRGDILIGPDNGLLISAAAGLGRLDSAWSLDCERVRQAAGLFSPLSATFHGRDLFAPAAALLSSGTALQELGVTVDAETLVTLAPQVVKVTETEALAEVIEVDRFGNVGLALPFDDLSTAPVIGLAREFLIDAPGEGLPVWKARLVRTYGDLRPGELGVFRDSWGQVALALNGASAAELLGVQRGMLIRLRSEPKPPDSSH